MSQLKAPNGKPSNLTPEQWKLVRTPQFKAWFGDWENDPENASKVVDENGEPLVVYHGSNNIFTIFDKQRIGSNTKASSEVKVGFYFTTDIVNAKSYATEKNNFLSCFLNVRNLGKWNFEGRGFNGEGMFGNFPSISEIVKIQWDKITSVKKGYISIDEKWLFDGILAENIVDSMLEEKPKPANTYVVWYPNQIKLADGSNTTFDGNNPDIRFAEGGEIVDKNLVYHGTGERTNVIKAFVTNSFRPFKSAGVEMGIFVTPIKELAQKYADITDGNDKGVVELKFQRNPKIKKFSSVKEQYDFENSYSARPSEANRLFMRDLISKGYDGTQSSDDVILIFKDKMDILMLKNSFDGNNPDTKTFSQGGKTKKYMKKIKRGGITYGKSHAEGGIPVKNQSTGDMLEVEGGEGIVNKRSMASKSKVKLNGKDLTICQAVSELNQMEGGVQFSCEDVSDRQFIRAMAKGGELDRGTRTEQEHIQVLKDLYAKRITPKQASERIAKDHLKEDSQYYSKLAKMEGKMADGGNVKKVKFSIEQDDEEDRIKISIKGIGEIILVETTPEYEFLEDIGEDGLEELNLNEDDLIGKIEHIEIADNFKGKGYAKILMNKAIAVAKEKGLMPLYLNASPMGFKGLNTTDLTAFYESFGFEVFLYQGHNNLMILNSSSNSKMADGGKTRKNAKTTLKEAVGFDINSIDISKL